ncbi:hypothetical protein BX600DRAFT_387867 [Xylariales sp. PMI_506]|nr:hypothetical protein BX600DRAFT_387867 [Xylariales sp. PMI_506]
MASEKLVWFVTGANTGFGLLIAQVALAHGHIVIATARDAAKFPQSLRDEPNADLIEIQISGPASDITAAVDAAVVRHGRIDVLVNNAGYGMCGAVEQVTEAQVRAQFDVNFFGLFNFTKAVIPHMRARKSGVIVQFSSLMGFEGYQGAPIYAASKFAVEGLSEGLYNELKPFGIRVHIVEPGSFRTNFLGYTTVEEDRPKPIEGYIDLSGILSGMHGKQPGDPEKAAKRIFEIVTGTGLGTGLESELRVILGRDSFDTLQAKIQKLTINASNVRDVALSTDLDV